AQGFPAQVLEALKADQFQLVLSRPLTEELVDVLSRPRIVKKYGLQPEDVAEFVALLEAKALVVDPPGELHVCRDPHDDIVLETALLGKADYLVSRDDDLKRDLELTRVMHERGVALVKQRFGILMVRAWHGSGSRPTRRRRSNWPRPGAGSRSDAHRNCRPLRSVPRGT